MFSDDTVVVSQISRDNTVEYEGVVRDFVLWSEANHLLLNTSKTKEMMVDHPVAHHQGGGGTTTSSWECT